jgi:hypothetical protein
VYAHAAYESAWKGWKATENADAQQAAQSAYLSMVDSYVEYYLFNSAWEITTSYHEYSSGLEVTTKNAYLGYYSAYESQYEAYVSLYKAYTATGNADLLAAYQYSSFSLVNFYVTDSVTAYLELML